MRIYIFLVLTGITLAIATTASCEDATTTAPSPNIQSKFESFNYDGSAFPETVGWKWISKEGTREIIKQSILTVDTTDSNGQHRYLKDLTTPLERGGKGYVVELSIAISSAENKMDKRKYSNAVFGIVICDTNSSAPNKGNSVYYVGIDRYGVGVSYDGISLPSYQSLAAANYNPMVQNKFSITRIGNRLTIYLDGTSVLDIPDLAAKQTEMRPRVMFGDLATKFDHAFQLNYIRGGTILSKSESGNASASR